MYEQYWGMRETPFSMTPDPRFLYMSQSHEDALNMLHYAVVGNRGAAVLAGDIGLGKTTVTRRLLQQLDTQTLRPVLIVNPILTPAQILREILNQLGVPTQEKFRQGLIKEMRETLLGLYDRGQRAVVIVDEAHLIRNKLTFEELRLLLNFQERDQFLISLVLVGQNELGPKLKRVPALEQRLAIRTRLTPLNVTETGEMIFFRMQAAGYSGDRAPFTPDAIHQIHRSSQGTPRLIIQIADAALLLGMVRSEVIVDGCLVHDVSRQRQEAA